MLSVLIRHGQADRDFKETALADVSKQLTVARAASERTVGEWQARSESKEAAVLTAKTNEIAGLQEQHARCGQPVARMDMESMKSSMFHALDSHMEQAVMFSTSRQSHSTTAQASDYHA